MVQPMLEVDQMRRPYAMIVLLAVGCDSSDVTSPLTALPAPSLTIQGSLTEYAAIDLGVILYVNIDWF